MNQPRIIDSVEQFWEPDIIDNLAEHIKTPNKSPMFDKDWEAKGYLHDAMGHVKGWGANQQIPRLEMELARCQLQNQRRIATQPPQAQQGTRRNEHKRYRQTSPEPICTHRFTKPAKPQHNRYRQPH